MIFSILALSIFFTQPPFIYDGDTFYYDKIGLRLRGIDAPEMDNKFGPIARDKLRAFLLNKDISCNFVEPDYYKRLVVSCTADGEDISKWMVRSGYAIAYRHYTTIYVEDEDYARIHSLGFWGIKPDWFKDSRSLKYPQKETQPE